MASRRIYVIRRRELREYRQDACRSRCSMAADMAGSWAGPPSAGNVFQHLSLSQGMVGRKWSLAASDNISYTFEAPTTGFTGVPGTGEPISGSGPTTPPDQTILTLNTRTLDNITTLTFTDKLNYATTLSLGGSLGQMHYIDNNGQNMETLTANTGVTRRLNAFNSVSGQYSYSRYSYADGSFTSQINTARFGVTHQWSRQLTTTVSAGPAWIAGSGISSTGGIALPNSMMLSLDASANYRLRRETAGLDYFHGNNGGAGYLLGAKIDNINANFSREFGKNLTVGATGSFMRTSSLFGDEFIAYCLNSDGTISQCTVQVSSTPVTDARYGGVQATRKLGRYLNIFVSYTAIDQSSNLQTNVQIISGCTTSPCSVSVNTNILNGLDQVISFGIGYSPREMHFRK